MSDLRQTTLRSEIEFLVGFPFKSTGYTSKGVRLLRGDNISQGTLTWSDAKKWPKSDLEKFKTYELQEGDIVIAMDRPWIDAGLKYATITEQDLPCLLVQRTARLRGGKNLDTKYLKYVIGSPEFTKYVKYITTGSLVPHISGDQIKDFCVSLPSLNTQEKVSEVLFCLDKKIECNNLINAKLEAMAKLLYDYWFVQFDYPDANGKPYKSSGGKMVYNPELKRDIPEGWQNKQLGQITNITMGSSPVGESLNDECEGVEFFQGSTDFGWRFPSVRQYTTKPVRMARQGDVLLSVRAPVGDLNLANIDCCIGRGLAALHSKDGFDGFLFYVMQYFKTIFDRRNSEGTTFGSITKDDLHSLALAYPPSDLLQKYNDVVSRYNSMIFVRSREIDQLTKLRDWLLPLLMNGQVTVE